MAKYPADGFSGATLARKALYQAVILEEFERAASESSSSTTP